MPPEPKIAIGALVLALEHSELKGAFDADRARRELFASQGQLIRGGVFVLQDAIPVLERIEGFKIKHCIPPFCRFKLWESKLELKIALPRAMFEFGEHEVWNHAQKCEVPEAELLHVFHGLEETGEFLAAPEKKKKGEKKKKRRGDSGFKKKHIPIAVAAVLALAAPVVIYFQLTQAGSYAADQVDFGNIPVRDVVKVGDGRGAILADPAWRSLPKKQRTDQLKEVLTKLGPSVRQVFLRDPDNKLVATVRWTKLKPGPKDIAVTFH